MTTDGSIPKVISTLTVNYKPAIDATKQLAAITAQLDHQLRTLRMTATDVGKGVGTGFHQPMQAGNVILDRHGKVLVDVGAKSEKLVQTTQTATTATQQHTTSVKQAAQAYSVLGSQWERRISWFVAGVGFYGMIRAMRQATETMRKVEMDMVVIQRTTNDVTFSFEGMRDELQNLGMAYGHTWETVGDIALRWTQAGYNMNDTLEQTRVGLLALNVAEMDVQMASQGMIAIMSQWDFTADELEGVIDKLNITSDNFAITTGDLVEALIRSSGAARAVNMTFEETIGVITATRVATGRTGREVGNATNTMLSFIMRQMTLNKLMKSGINVFADAANTKLRPAIDILTDVADKWGNRAEEMPEQLIEIAEEMGLMSEEMAEVVGLQEEWTDLQKIDIETSAAGVRRRSFFIALLRNFAQVQEVVTNMHDSEGYSMRQNILTMETLEKRQEQLRVSLEKLAVAIGDAGLMEQLKLSVDILKTMVEGFNKLDDTTKTMVVTFLEITLGLKVLNTLLRMTGVTTSVVAVASAAAASAEVAYATAVHASAAASAYAAKTGTALAATRAAEAAVAVVAAKAHMVATAAAATALKIKLAAVTVGLSLIAAGVATHYIQQRRLREEHELYIETLDAVATEQERLDRIIAMSVQGSTASNLALEQKRELVDSILKRYPDLLAGYDLENEMFILNAEKIKDATKAYELYKETAEDLITVNTASIQSLMEEGRQHEDSAKRIEQLYTQRENLIESLKEEGLSAEENARRKIKIQHTDEAIIRITKQLDNAIKTSADITRTQIDRMIQAFRDKGDAAEDSARRVIAASEAEARVMIAVKKMDRAWQHIQLDELLQERTDVQNQFSKPILPRGQQIYKDIKIDDLTNKITESSGKITSYTAEIRALESFMQELDKIVIDAAGSTGGFGKAAEKAGKDTKSTTDLLAKFIEAAMRAAHVQGLLNKESQRSIDSMRARIDFMTRDNATAWERQEALREEALLLEMLKEKQEGVHKEANYLRGALQKLQIEQNRQNLSTEAGREAYGKLESQIDSIRDSINKLSIEWFALARAQEIGISGLERIRSLRATEISAMEDKIAFLARETGTLADAAKADELRLRLMELYTEKLMELNNKIREQEREQQALGEAIAKNTITQLQYNQALADSQRIVAGLRGEYYDYRVKLENAANANYELARSIKRVEEEYRHASRIIDYFAGLGVFTVEEQLSKTLQLYNKYGNLTVEQEMDKYRRLSSAYKDMLMQMKTDAEDAYRERIRLLDQETNDAIAIIQRQIDAINQEAEDDKREESLTKHLQTIQELTDRRRYHEMRTGTEHTKAIVDIDRRISEEQMRWERQQAEWDRQDRIADFNKEINDIRDNADEQKDEWQKAYDRLQADFSNHNVAMIALAAAYDPSFFEDAKRKGELWLQGFKSGLPQNLVGDYLGSLVGGAQAAKDTIWDNIQYQPPPEPYDPYKPPITAPTQPLQRIINIAPSEYDVVDGRAYMKSRALAGALSEPVSWDSVKKQVVIGNQYFQPFTGAPKYQQSLADGTAWVGIREVGERLGWMVEWANNQVKMVKNAHTGALTLSHGVANLKRGELIFPPNLSTQLQRLIAMLSHRPLPAQGRGDVGTSIAIDRVLNIERAMFEDNVDVEIVGREITRQLNRLRQ